MDFIKRHIHRFLQNYHLITQKHQAQKTGKSVPGGYVFGRTRYENTAKVRLVGTFEPRQTRSAAQEKFHKWALRGKPGLPGFQGAG